MDDQSHFGQQDPLAMVRALAAAQGMNVEGQKLDTTGTPIVHPVAEAPVTDVPNEAAPPLPAIDAPQIAQDFATVEKIIPLEAHPAHGILAEIEAMVQHAHAEVRDTVMAAVARLRNVLGF